MSSKQSEILEWLTTWMCYADTVPDSGYSGLSTGQAQFPSHPEYGTVGSSSQAGPTSPSGVCPTGGSLSSPNPQQEAAPTTPATFGRKMLVSLASMITNDGAEGARECWKMHGLNLNGLKSCLYSHCQTLNSWSRKMGTDHERWLL